MDAAFPSWMSRVAGLAAVVAFMLTSPLDADEINFDRDIRPILSDKCFHCHGPDQKTREADLRLDTRAGAMGNDDATGAVIPGKPDDSELWRRVSSRDASEQMPPADSGRSLSDAERDLLRRWIAEGAPWTEHWAFVPPGSPPLPSVKQESWSRTPVDRFILARIEQAGLRPSPEASKETLIRRVTIDLTGLPPTIDEIDAFLADNSPAAYDKVVDRLLASPRYGERMVWDWLDAARYADSNGYQGDPERTMWPWRDWVIRALNDNMPFDQFTIEQIAGDRLPDATLEQVVATGFNRNHMFNGEGGRIAEETRVENVMDRAETTATVWLGMTLGCARCHDHKYDPITQRDYYRFYAFFNNTSENGGASGSARRGQIEPLVAVPSPEESQKLAPLQEERAKLLKTLQESEDRLKVPAASAHNDPTDAGKKNASGAAAPAEATKPSADKSVDKPAEAKRATISEETGKNLAIAVEKRSTEQLKQLSEVFRAEFPEYAKQLDQWQQVTGRIKSVESGIPKVMVMDTLPSPRTTHILVRGAYNQTAEEVTSGWPAIFERKEVPSDPDRLDLARWLVSPENPLTARVTVNRYWQLFFGRGLVKTPEDFGVQGEKPSHPQLLDWLASRFVESGWDVKQMHRLLVTSAVYRQSSKLSPELLQRDPENVLLARAPRYRWPSWILRDQALAASGLLVERLGGPPVMPYQPSGLWAEATFGKKKYVQDHGEALYRRSVYTFWRRIIGPPVFFDSASRQTCAVKQTRTNTPLHALTTLNDVTFVESARKLAEVVLQNSRESTDAALALAFRRTTSRHPSSREKELLKQAFENARQNLAGQSERIQQLLGVGESARDEKLNAEQHAAMTSVCLLLLNLDETLSKQ